MKRRELLKSLGALGIGLPFANTSLGLPLLDYPAIKSSDFGDDFIWGVATASYQIEGAVSKDGREPSIWDTFSEKKGKIKTGETGAVACDFYNRYPKDIELVKKMNFDVFRFSLAWSRILPNGTGKINQKGIDFYHRIIDSCLENNVQPWITLYHWDLPQALEDKGGWKNRDIIDWFGEYSDLCTRKFGDKVKNWMILNEPVAFTVLGYLLGIHAPGKRGFRNLYPTIHHTAMCQSEGGRIVRQNVKDANVGTTFSCSSVHAYRDKKKDSITSAKLDALLNRLYIEPCLGMGYPTDGWKLLENVSKYIKDGDMEKLSFDFDFIGLQNYTRVMAKHSPFIPFLWGSQVHPKKRNVEMTEMEWEVYPKGIYEMIKKFKSYDGVDKIIITENGCAYKDEVSNGVIDDQKRIKFYREYLEQVLKAKQEGANIAGYFCWSLLDNFEWAEGYRPRFGLVHINYENQRRTIKNSGYWFREFLSK